MYPARVIITKGQQGIKSGELENSRLLIEAGSGGARL